MKTPSICCRWFYRSFNVVLSLKKCQHWNGLNAHLTKGIKGYRKIYTESNIYFTKFKIKICNILEKHDIRKKSIKLFYKENVR